MGKYQDSKRKFKENKANQRPRAFRAVLPISGNCCTEKGYGYDYDSLVKILMDFEQRDVYSRFSLPVYMENSLLRGDPDKRGKTIVGFIRGMDENETDIAITINPHFVEKFKAMKNPVVTFNGIVHEEEMTTILSATIIDEVYDNTCDDCCDDEEDDSDIIDDAEEEDQ